MQGGGQKNRFSLPYDFCATLACSMTMTMSPRSRRYFRIASCVSRWSFVGRKRLALKEQGGRVGSPALNNIVVMRLLVQMLLFHLL